VTRWKLLGLAMVLMVQLIGFAAVTPPVAAEGPATPTKVVPGRNCYRIPTGQKVVALTFDDWCSEPKLKSVLATLKAAGVDATFFPNGEWVALYPDLARSIIAAGYDIGSHSYSHPVLPDLRTADMRSEIQKTEEALAAVGAKDPAPLFRTPYGAWNPRLLRVLRSEGYVNILWTCDGSDYIPGRTAPQVVNAIVSRLRPGAIILMHVESEPTPVALPELIRQIKARGYRFVNLSEALFSPQQRMPRYQQTSPLLTYSGDWSEWSSPSESGGSLHYTRSEGAAVTASFTGTTFELLAVTGPNYGKALVAIDGGKAQEVDLYSPAYLHRCSVFKITDLADTVHTALISCSGAKNIASSGSYIDIDALRVAGALLQAPRLP
jgi:peptidoglycan/xylan/chitin deacetylase (PgdA/CDA1 family)